MTVILQKLTPPACPACGVTAINPVQLPDRVGWTHRHTMFCRVRWLTRGFDAPFPGAKR